MSFVILVIRAVICVCEVFRYYFTLEQGHMLAVMCSVVDRGRHDSSIVC